MSDSRSVGVKGNPLVANYFEVELSETDRDQFGLVEDSLVRELSDAARETARDEGWRFMGPVEVVLVESPKTRRGQFTVRSRMKEADGASGVLHLSDGQQVVLGEYLLSLGRLPECTITFDDTNVSRNHAEIRPHGNGFVITDLNSTNGTTVNGNPITHRRLEDGDRIRLGASSSLEFRAG